MDIVKIIMDSKNTYQAFKDINLENNKWRYYYESLIVGLLANNALNKEKNRNKPNFEGLELIDIFTHLMSEVHEIKHELNQNNIDFNKLIDEIGDCAALLSGLIAYIMEHKNEKKS